MFLYTSTRTLIICGICPGMHANAQSSFYFRYIPFPKPNLNLSRSKNDFHAIRKPRRILNLGKDPPHRNYHLHYHSHTGSLKICHPLDPRLLILPSFYVQRNKNSPLPDSNCGRLLHLLLLDAPMITSLLSFVKI